MSHCSHLCHSLTQLRINELPTVTRHLGILPSLTYSETAREGCWRNMNMRKSRKSNLLYANSRQKQFRELKAKFKMHTGKRDTPSTLMKYSQVPGCVFDSVPSPVGDLTIVASPTGIHAVLMEYETFGGRRDSSAMLSGLEREPSNPMILEARRQLEEYFTGDRVSFSLSLKPLEGTSFQRAAWAALHQIPFGETISYGEQARAMGISSSSARAVGAANGRNPLPILTPCHRVIGKSGDLVGFASGVEKKLVLLQLERQVIAEQVLTSA